MGFFKRYCKILIGLAIIVGLCVGLFLFKRSNSPQGLRTVKVAQFGDVFIYTPLYLADIMGFFEDEGLKIQLINTGSDARTYAAVVGGSALFGVTDPVLTAIAQEKGFDGRVIGGIVNGVPFWAITNKEIPQITDGKMLQPYSVATFPEPSTAYSVQKKMFQDAGLEPNIKQGAFGGILAMLEAGNVDIALETEPNISTAIANGAKEVYSFVNIYPEFAFSGITTSQKTIEKDPGLVQHFINAITKAEEYAHHYPDSAAFYLRKYFSEINEGIIYDAINRMVDSNALPKNAIISDKAWMEAVELRHELKELQSPSKARIVLDMSFATRAIQ